MLRVSGGDKPYRHVDLAAAFSENRTERPQFRGRSGERTRFRPAAAGASQLCSSRRRTPNARTRLLPRGFGAAKHLSCENCSGVRGFNSFHQHGEAAVISLAVDKCVRVIGFAAAGSLMMSSGSTAANSSRPFLRFRRPSITVRGRSSLIERFFGLATRASGNIISALSCLRTLRPPHGVRCRRRYLPEVPDWAPKDISKIHPARTAKSLTTTKPT